MTTHTKIIIADDHPLFRQALSLMLTSSFTDSSLLEAQTIAELEQALIDTPEIDLILLDLDIPGAEGFNTLNSIRLKYPHIAVVVISGFEESETINKAIEFGAAGFIPKSTPVNDMVAALNSIINGELWVPSYALKQGAQQDKEESKISTLTNQQRKILFMLADGLLNKQIAYDLNLSESTIKSHVSTIFLKLGVKNRTQAVILLNHHKHEHDFFTHNTP
ncbi:DNA-binding response regulator, LuxR family protein [Alteromonadales bacterium TW-7]|nr:DNA-binding response regulator, LuxR family protein [Alteromonadales bacterium TW-7]